MALNCSSSESTIDRDFFVQSVTSMSRGAFNKIDVGDEKHLRLHKAAVLLMQVIVNLAADYTLGWGAPPTSDNGSDKCEVYVWGSNASCQLAEEKNEKIFFLKPRKAVSFQNVKQVEAGLHCTFVVHSTGEVTACGKGTYGRLGLGDSSSQCMLKKIPFDCKIKKLVSSKGSDGHSLALSDNGQVYSWGDGDFGKLGHGNTQTQRQPKLVEGPLQHSNVVQISVGYRHSAAVTSDGRLFIWGEGDMGRLGLGDDGSRNLPSLVPDLSGVGSVSCGANHTLVLSSDGRTVWSFGCGEGGKLGHGDTSNRYRPTVIENIQGLYIKKVIAGNQFSLALTSHGSTSSHVALPVLHRTQRAHVRPTAPTFANLLQRFRQLQLHSVRLQKVGNAGFLRFRKMLLSIIVASLEDRSQLRSLIVLCGVGNTGDSSQVSADYMLIENLLTTLLQNLSLNSGCLPYLFNSLCSDSWNDANMMELYKVTLRLRCCLLCYDKDCQDEHDLSDPMLPNMCGNMLIHGHGGRGYGLGNVSISSGCYQWKFVLTKEHKGNEGTCIGLSKWPIQDYSHRTTKDMWLYRAYRWAVTGKLLECEYKVLLLSMISLCSMRALGTLLNCNKYSELLVDPSSLLTPFSKDAKKLATWMLENPSIDSDMVSVDVSAALPEPPGLAYHEMRLTNVSYGAYFYEVLDADSPLQRRCVAQRRPRCADIRNYLVERSDLHQQPVHFMSTELRPSEQPYAFCTSWMWRGLGSRDVRSSLRIDYFSGPNSNLSEGLFAMGLDDIRKVVRLMTLMAGSQSSALSNLSAAIGSIISTDQNSSKLVVYICAQSSICACVWDPTGRYLALCANQDKVCKIYSVNRDLSWQLDMSLQHDHDPSTISWSPFVAEYWAMAVDNQAWSIKQDEEIMSWATTQPQDWQLGSKCEAYLWGNGRHGQLAEIGRTHSAAWTVPPVPRRKPGVSRSAQFGLPSSVPAQYGHLQNTPIPAIQARLSLLHQFSDTLYSCWMFLPLCSLVISSVLLFDAWYARVF
ncbi:unnamed protein product [Nesidiocoris tenuis]|uniref:E3 ubiquitin-protein ligase HERC2 n=1 Tax=Nesidiocoris tenuis TaxID=355587 RepID=A0A6H5FXV8_9HEMI|nr:unnamed protein product [Nesidiocoris tenuis]